MSPVTWNMSVFVDALAIILTIPHLCLSSIRQRSQVWPISPWKCASASASTWAIGSVSQLLSSPPTQRGHPRFETARAKLKEPSHVVSRKRPQQSRRVVRSVVRDGAHGGDDQAREASEEVVVPSTGPVLMHASEEVGDVPELGCRTEANQYLDHDIGLEGFAAEGDDAGGEPGSDDADDAGADDAGVVRRGMALTGGGHGDEMYDPFRKEGLHARASPYR